MDKKGKHPSKKLDMDTGRKDKWLLGSPKRSMFLTVIQHIHYASKLWVTVKSHEEAFYIFKSQITMLSEIRVRRTLWVRLDLFPSIFPIWYFNPS